MAQVKRIACTNNAGFVMNFSIRWKSDDNNWNTTSWNSGSYPINQTRISPDLRKIGVPVQARVITPYVYAILGKNNMGTPAVEYQPNDRTGTYIVEGTTDDYSVKLL